MCRGNRRAAVHRGATVITRRDKYRNIQKYRALTKRIPRIHRLRRPVFFWRAPADRNGGRGWIVNCLGRCLIEPLISVFCKIRDNGRAGCHCADNLDIEHNLAIAVGVLTIRNRKHFA
jgi:hypothetical protein